MSQRLLFINKQQAKKYKVKYRGGHFEQSVIPESLLDKSLSGVFLIQDEKAVYVNPALANLYGYRHEEMIGKSLISLIYPDDYELLSSEMKDRLNGIKKEGPYRIRGIRKDGSIFYFETCASTIMYKGAPAFIGTIIDLTHKMYPGELLIENDLGYQKLIRYLPEPIIVHDGSALIYVNHAGLKLFGGVRQEQLTHKSFLDLIHPDYKQATKELMQKVLQTDETFEFMESQCLDLQGRSIDVEVSSVRIHSSTGGRAVIQSIFRDITDRKRSEEALVQSEKLSVAGQMAAGIAHEIRNPLTSLKGFTQLLRSKMKEHHEYLDIMLTELDRINEIVTEFMAFTKPQVKVNQFAYKDLGKVLSSVITLLDTQAIMSGVQILFSTENDIPLVCCDENQLKQVFINVLKNALEAMHEGGFIHVELKNLPPDTVSIVIKDQGSGIPKEQLEKLGNPFYTTKSNGTGLGLMVCYRIIEAHKGKIGVTSEPGEGTEVTILLPVSVHESCGC